RCGNHRGGRRLRPTGVDDPRAVVRHRRHDGGERLRPAVVDRSQHRAGLGAHAAGRDGAVRNALLYLLAPRLEHDPEKWRPVFRKDHAPLKLAARRFDKYKPRRGGAGVFAFPETKSAKADYSWPYLWSTARQLLDTRQL